MHAIVPADWTEARSDLWRRIKSHAFERPDHALDFTSRLARDRGWSLAYARGAVAEYRRFCFLAMACGVPLTPSEEVDEVWHQHLTYSRDYWDAWCGRALGGPLHHDPTIGGPAAGAHYRARYAETLALYEAWFGAPDPAYWPATHRRFRARPRYRTVDRDRALVLPRPAWRDGFARLRDRWRARFAVRAPAVLALVGGATALVLDGPSPALAQVAELAQAGGLAPDPFDWPAGPFLRLYAGLAAALVVLVAALSWRLRAAGQDRTARAPTPAQVEARAADLDLLHLAWLAGGRRRATDTVLVALVDAGAAQVGARRSAVGAMTLPDIEIDARGIALPPPFDAFRGLIRGFTTRAGFGRAVAPRVEAVGADVARRGLAPAPPVVARTRLTIAAAVALVAAFGLARVAVGLTRGRPVGYLVAMIVLTVIAAVLVAVLVPVRTPLGGAVLRHHRARYARAASAPRAHELLYAFAMGGAAVLTGTHLAEVGRLIRRSDSSSGTGGDSGGGGGDGGGGGGGCGGCGGGS